MRKLALAAATAALVGLLAGTVYALPASKVAIVQGDLFGLATACVIDQEGGGGLTCDNPPSGGNAADTGFVTVMTTFIKTPNNKELAMDVGLQCGLITFTEAKAKGTGGGKTSDKATAEGRIQVRVALTPVDREGATTGATFYALPNDDSANSLEGPTAASGPDGVTYCFRNQELEVAFEDLVCVDDTTDQCVISVSLLLETLDAHAFNFVAPNVAPGIKKIEVQARATAGANIFADDIGKAKGEAFVGMGSMLVETVRAVQAFDENTGIDPDITDLE